MNIKRTLLDELREFLRDEHYAGTTYEDEEHDPFSGKNGGEKNNGYDWQGNFCDCCKLLLDLDRLVIKGGGKTIGEKK